MSYLQAYTTTLANIAWHRNTDDKYYKLKKIMGFTHI